MRKRKIYFELVVLWAIVFFSFFFWPSFAMAKYQVCSITINSSDEIETFRKYLGVRDFSFVELVPLSVESRPNNVHWFTDACNKGHHCDILVISGHFGGLFFGETHNYILPVDIMEKRSCSNSCSGLLSNVKEVFLFGCNTLAGKRSDARSPEEYLQVLLDHHMARDMAETVVATRYLPFGLSFKDQMRMVFPSQTSIYGFTSLSPLGKDIRQPLSNYFDQINKYYGNYKSYLDQKNSQRRNNLIYQTIGGTVSETRGVGSSDSQYPVFQKMCHLYKNDIDKVEGIQVANELIESGNGPEAYLAIKSFISENQPFTGDNLVVFNKIKNNSDFKREFYILYNQINRRLPYIRIQFLNFLNFFDWVSDSFYKSELKSNTVMMIRKPTSEAYDFATALIYDERIDRQDLNLTGKDFHSGFYQNIWSALILEVFNIQDYKVHRRLMNTCLSKIGEDPVICYQVLKTLGHLKVNDSLIVDKMLELLSYSHSGLIYYTIYSLAYSGIKNRSVHRAIANHFNHHDQWIQLQAIRAVGFLKSEDAHVNKMLIEVVKNSQNEKIIYEGLHSLHYMSPSIRDIRQVIVDRKFYEHSDRKIRNLAVSF